MSLSPALRTRAFALGVAVTLVAVGSPTAPAATESSPPPTAATADLDLSQGNRRAPLSGLYDWSKAGYRGGADLPGSDDITTDADCLITSAELGSQFGVHPDDDTDDSTGLQRAIDKIRTDCSPGAGYSDLSLISLPAGRLDVSRQLSVDADYLILRGAGPDTRIVFRPDENTRYDTLTPDGSDWDEDGMTHGAGKGGWIWPGRGLFRVQSRQVHSGYASDHASAPADRKDLFEGTVNVHWKSGLKLRGKPGDTAYAARAGDRVVYLGSGSLTHLQAGRYVNIRAANSQKFYQLQQALPTQWPLLNMHMRQQIFTISSVDTGQRTITLDKPLEYDVPVTSTSDGSPPIAGTTYDSKAAPLVDPVQGVGFENLSLTHEIDGLDPADATNNYGNMAPAEQMHGIVFKWVVDSWVRGVHTELTGSHPIVTEEAKNLQIVDNHLDGSWNKGKGGNGYFRGSRVWDSLYAGNVSRNLRHFTFQWSASGNVVIGNDFDSDLNLHGGWERNNLFELNTVNVPYAHRPGNCDSHCGDEGGDEGGSAPDDSNWYPIWWGAGKKAVKWSGSSGPRNVFFNNHLTKQLTSDSAPYTDYYPERHRIYQFGWDGTGWQHLDVGGTPIADWAHNEHRDFTGGHGVDAGRTDPAESLFLKSVGSDPTTPPGDDVVAVSTGPELEAALANARPGQTIDLAPGEYHGVFRTRRAGTASQPITLTGPHDAVLVNDGPSGTPPSCPEPVAGFDSGYGLWLYDAPHWNLQGFTVAHSKKGIVLDNSTNVTIDGVYVHHMEEEGVHFRKSSSDGVIRDSRIEQVGLVKPQYGEGVYIGSAKSNFTCYGNSGGLDRSDRVQVLDNHIGPYVAAEHIDVKEGTRDGVVRGNTFDGRGIAGQNSADSWVDAKGIDYLFEDNTGTFRSPGVFANGYETHNPLDGYGCGNVWRNNRSDLGGAGDYAIRITSESKCRANPNVVHSGNTVTNAQEGLTNIDVITVTTERRTTTVRRTALLSTLPVIGLALAVTGTVSATTAPPPEPVVTAAEELLSLNRAVQTSSIETSALSGPHAVDGDASTRWGSLEGVDPQWIRIDLGDAATINRIVLNWETAHASAYTLQVSDDGTSWTTVATVSDGDGAVDEHAGLNAQGRYVRMHGTERATQWGYSLWEFEVYGTGGGEEPPPTGDTPAEINGQLAVCGVKLCNQYGNPIQLRGMSSHGLQWYSQCLPDPALDALAGDWNADVLRISMYIQEGGYETDPAGFTDRVSALIDEATDRGMYAIVDWHMLSPGDPHHNLSRARTFFTEIARRHNANTNLIYEIANEPSGVSWSRIKSYAETLIPVIRAVDPQTPVVVGTRAWSSLGVSEGASETEVVNNPVNATNILYSFHFYAASHREEYLNTLSRAADRIPVFVTEFGTQDYAGEGANDFTMSQRYLDLMAQKKISWVNWNFSDDHRSGAVFTTGTCPGGPYAGTSRLKPAGSWIRDRIRTPDNFPTD